MSQADGPHPEWVAYEPALVPSLARMASEGITLLEECFCWGRVEHAAASLWRNGRPGFDNPRFEFNHEYGGCGNEFATVEPVDPERMTASRRALVVQLARRAGPRLACEPLLGYWSVACDSWIGAQNVLVVTPA